MNKKQVALITGASSGFGLLTALELARAGFKVAATMRQPDKKDQLMDMAQKQGLEKAIHVYRLDVTDSEEGIAAAISDIVDKMGSVNVLVNNAGYALGGFVEETTLAEWHDQFNTNFFGTVAVTRAMLPYMRRAGKGRIINVSSISGLMGLPGLAPYVSSKFAVEGFSESLRLEVAPFGIDVVLIEPGSYQTGIWTTGNRIAQGSQSPQSPYRVMMQKIEKYLQASQSGFGDPQEVARLIGQVAQEKKPRLRYPVGKGVKSGVLLQKTVPWKMRERIILRILIKKERGGHTDD